MQDDPYARRYAGEDVPAGGWPLEGPAAATPIRRTRSGVVVLVAVLLELILIGGADNQWASRKIAEAIGPGSGLGTNAARSWLVYAWRAGAAPGDTFHAWVAMLALIGTLVALTALLVWAAARGTAGFGRVFLGTWTAVVAATQVAVVVAGVVVDPDIYGYPANRLDAALFAGLPRPRTVALSNVHVQPGEGLAGISRLGGGSVLAGLGLGLLVALAAGIAAVLARRRVAPAGQLEESDEGVGFFDGSPSYASARQDPYALGPQHTQQLPRVDAPRQPGNDDTTTLPRVQGPPYGPTTPPPPFVRPPQRDDDEHTARFPRVPPDEPQR